MMWCAKLFIKLENIGVEMKILFLSDLLAYGGASKLLYDLLPRIKNQGHECELLILTDKNSKYITELQQDGVVVNVVPSNIKGHVAKVRYINKWIKNGQYDVVHANLFPMTYYCSLSKRMLGKRFPYLVMTEHSTDNKRRHIPLARPLEKFIYAKYDHVISISDKTQEHLCDWLGAKNNRFSVIENGIDIEEFSKAEAFSKSDICTNYLEGDVLLLAIGSFTPQKNHEKLLEALSILPQYYKLILCGEGPLEDSIRLQVNNLKLNDRVIFLGFRRDVAKILHTVDILVVPSIWEGFGLVAAEGMACGKPIIASDVPGLSDVVGEAGIKINPNNAQSIANAVSSLTKVEAERLISLGKERVQQYSIQRTVDRYINIYKMLIGGR